MLRNLQFEFVRKGSLCSISVSLFCIGVGGWKQNNSFTFTSVHREKRRELNTHTLIGVREYTNTHPPTKKGCCTDKGTKESDKKKGRNYGKEHSGKERSRVLRGLSEIPLQFMEFVEDRLPRLQEPTAGPCPKPVEHTQPPSCFIKVYCNTIFQPTQVFSKWSLSSRCCYQNSVYMFLFSLLCNTFRLFPSLLFDGPSNNWRGTEVL